MSDACTWEYRQRFTPGAVDRLFISRQRLRRGRGRHSLFLSPSGLVVDSAVHSVISRRARRVFFCVLFRPQAFAFLVLLALYCSQGCISPTLPPLWMMAGIYAQRLNWPCVATSTRSVLRLARKPSGPQGVAGLDAVAKAGRLSWLLMFHLGVALWAIVNDWSSLLLPALTARFLM